MSKLIILTLGVIKVVQLLSVLSILILAFVAPDGINVSVVVFGITVALMAVIVLTEGLSNGRLLTQTAPITRVEQPLRFWGMIGLNAFTALIGLALTQSWRLYQ